MAMWPKLSEMSCTELEEMAKAIKAEQDKRDDERFRALCNNAINGNIERIAQWHIISVPIVVIFFDINQIFKQKVTKTFVTTIKAMIFIFVTNNHDKGITALLNDNLGFVLSLIL